jgi:predicted small lipoprotein YifL
MKKFLVFLLAIFTVVAFCACGATEAGPGKNRQ